MAMFPNPMPADLSEMTKGLWQFLETALWDCDVYLIQSDRGSNNYLPPYFIITHPNRRIHVLLYEFGPQLNNILDPNFRRTQLKRVLHQRLPGTPSVNVVAYFLNFNQATLAPQVRFLWDKHNFVFFESDALLAVLRANNPAKLDDRIPQILERWANEVHQQADVIVGEPDQAACELIPQNPKFPNDDGGLRELVIFNALKGLPENWVVFSRNWYQNEMDFVVAHPQKGVVIIEVKGGQHVQQGHCKQLDRQKKNLSSLLKCEDIHTYLAYPDWENGVTLVPQNFPAPPPTAVVCGAQQIGMTLKELPGAGNFAEVIDHLRYCFSVRIESIRYPWHGVGNNIEIHLNKDPKFIRSINDAFSSPWVRAAGGPGSGKTLLAKEDVRGLIKNWPKSEAGPRILYFGFTPDLLAEVKKWHTDGNFGGELDAFNMSDLYKSLSEKFPYDPILARFGDKRADAEGDPHRDKWQPLLVEFLATHHPEIRYDAIICDEAQNYRVYYWNALKALRKRSFTPFHVFHDQAQQIAYKPKTGNYAYVYPWDRKKFPQEPNRDVEEKLGRPQFPKNLKDWRKIHLKKRNYRNPARIAFLLNKLNLSLPLRDDDDEGFFPGRIEVSHANDPNSFSIITAEINPDPGETVILTDFSRRGDWSPYYRDDVNPADIKWEEETVRGYQGLQKMRVILWLALEDTPVRKEKLGEDWRNRIIIQGASRTMRELRIISNDRALVVSLTDIKGQADMRYPDP